MEEYKKDDRGREKAKRLTKNDPHSKVDSSTWTPDASENAGVKTGARPLTKRLFKKGGKVIGNNPIPRADRKPRKSGGRALTADTLINRNVREANEDREGIKHDGAFKKGGAAKYGKGGRMPLEGHPYHKKTDAELRYISKDAAEAARAMKGMNSQSEGKYLDQMNDAQTVLGHRKRTGNGPEVGMKKGGKVHKFGGGMLGNNPVSQQDMMNGKASGVMKKGGRAKHATDGKVPMPIPRPAGMDYPDGKVPMPSRRPVSLDAGNMTPDQVNVAQKSVDKGVDPYGDGTALVRAHKRGGKVHSDEAQDKKLMHKVLKPKAFKASGGSTHGEHCGCERCSGGRTMKYAGGGVFSGNSKEKNPGEVGGRKAHAKGGRTKGTTTINIVMAPRGGQDQANMPNAPVMPPKPPMGVPVPPPQMAGGAPPMGGMPPQMPPQMPGRATGGRTRKMVGGSLGNAGGMQPMMQQR